MATPSKTEALIELPLGEPGLAYVSRCLENETSFVQDMRRLSFHGGSVFGVVPEGTDLKRAQDFWAALGISMRGPNIWLTDRMIARCRANPQSVIVFDDPWGERRDSPPAAWLTAPKFFHRNFVDYFVTADSAGEQTVDAAMRAIGGFLFIAAFVEYPLTADMLDADGAIDDQLMQKLAESVREIYVSAYDHDSYVVWQR